MFPVFSESADAMTVVGAIGGITAITAALTALVMTDIKRVLAYSTISQLGYMMLALGIGAYVAAIFHLFTHAFFKALLFLGSGSVNHATNTFDMRLMGGLRKQMPITHDLLIGALTSGVFRPVSVRDDISDAPGRSTCSDRLVGRLTAFMFRAIFLTFGEYHRRRRGRDQPRPRRGAPPPPRRPNPTVAFGDDLPLIALAVMAVVGGFNLPWASSARPRDRAPLVSALIERWSRRSSTRRRRVHGRCAEWRFFAYVVYTKVIPASLLSPLGPHSSCSRSTPMSYEQVSSLPFTKVLVMPPPSTASSSTARSTASDAAPVRVRRCSATCKPASFRPTAPSPLAASSSFPSSCWC
jgi:hypothetical protein